MVGNTFGPIKTGGEALSFPMNFGGTIGDAQNIRVKYLLWGCLCIPLQSDFEK